MEPKMEKFSNFLKNLQKNHRFKSRKKFVKYRTNKQKNSLAIEIILIVEAVSIFNNLKSDVLISSLINKFKV